jgi:hypothetical protein
MSIGAEQSTSEMIRDALRAAASSLPGSVEACEFAIDFDEDLEMHIARVAMILDSDQWGPDAEAACQAASDVAWNVLSPLGVIPDVLCRTRPEHQAVRDTETWISVAANGNC